MGLEASMKKKVRMTRLRMAILASIKIGGLVTAAAIAPNVAGLLGKSINAYETRKMRSAMRRLKDAGLLSYKDGHIAITASGIRYLEQGAWGTAPPPKWDKKWRIVIFDIPEYRKTLRNALRDALRRIGFLKLQNSVWIYPYDCEELVILLKADYHIGKEVLYTIADELEGSDELKAQFNL